MKKHLIILTFAILTTACQTTDLRPVDLHAYLLSYLGMSSADIQQKLNFKSLGYQSAQAIQRNNQLIYTLYQPMNIPIAQSSDLNNPLPSSANSYDLNLKCHVIFNLENGIARSVSYEGKAC